MTKKALVILLVVGMNVLAFGERINVKDFGAKGDGKTDDTAAIQKALTATGKSRKSMKMVRSGGKSIGGSSTSQAIVVIPAGIYIISDTLLLGGTEMVLRGEGNPVIHMKNDAKDIISTGSAWRMRIEGITFQNGRNQLNIHNQNLDKGMVVIEHCRFILAAGKAIEVEARSIVVYIEHCIFDQCEQVLTTRNDMNTMRSCWITSSSTMANNKAVIENHSEQLLFEDMILVPLVHGSGQRWIDNYGLKVICRSSRFGAEGGGFTPVYNFRKPRKKGTTSSIIMENNWVAANASYNANCAVYCVEVPNMIVVRNNDLIGSKPIIVHKKINLERYFYGVKPQLLHFKSDGNVGELSRDFPDLLKKPLCLPDKNKKMGMSDKEVKRLLAEAKKQVQPLLKEEATGLALKDHKQKTDATDFIQIDPNKDGWTLDEVMDATAVLNKTHLAVLPLESDILIMRRTDSGGNWPHVTFGPIEVDLDKYPWITYRIKNSGEGKYPGHAVRVIDLETGAMVLVNEHLWMANYNLFGTNLKKLLGVSGKRKLLVRFYYLGIRNFEKQQYLDQAGQYLLLDFIRFEKD